MKLSPFNKRHFCSVKSDYRKIRVATVGFIQLKTIPSKRRNILVISCTIFMLSIDALSNRVEVIFSAPHPHAVCIACSKDERRTFYTHSII